MRKNISGLTQTTLALMKYVKSEECSYQWKDVRKNVLGSLYHDKMSVVDVLHISLGAWIEARQLAPLQMHYDNETAVRKLLIKPITDFGQLGKLQTPMTIENVLQSQLEHILHELRYTKVDWMREDLA